MSLKSSDSHRRVLGEAPHERKVGLTGRKGGAHYGVRRGLLVTGVAVSVLLAGCSAAGPSASGTVSSSAGPTATRSATPTPTPVMMCAPDNERRACTPEELEHAEDFLAVTAQHDAFTEEMNEWLMSGAPEDSVPRFEQYADGEVLDAALGSGAEFRENRARNVRAVVVDPLLFRSAGEDRLIFVACMDAQDMQAVDTETGDIVGEGYQVASEVTAQKLGTVWKMVSEREVDWRPCA